MQVNPGMPAKQETGDSQVVFNNVTFGYGPLPAVEDVAFTVQRGDYVALIGPNGSGKTTLVKLLLGLEDPQRGSVTLFGQDSRNFNQWRRIGYVPQQANAFRMHFPATVAEVVESGEYKGFSPWAIFRRRVSEATQQSLEAVGMWGLRKRLISDLSVGQQQRVLIARALVHYPELLILDEPTAGVDAAGQEQFFSLLRHVREDLGVTVILVSHDIGLVLQEATNVACINRTLHCYRPADEITNSDLSHLYGSAVDRVIHRHE